MIDESAPVVINATVKKWIAEISSSKISCEAELGVEVFDPGNRVVYTGRYKGFSSVQSTSLQMMDVENALGTAMSQALSQLGNDKRFVGIVSSF